MTPESPAPPVPSRPVRPLLTGLLLLVAVSGWTAAFVAYTRNKEPEPQTQPQAPPGAAVVFHLARTPPALWPGGVPADAGEFESYRTAQSTLLRRRPVLYAVLKRPDVANLGVIKAQADPVAWLADNLRVSFDAPEFMRVELDGEPVEELVVVLSALAKAYLADVDERDNGARRDRLRKLEETNRAYRAEIERFHKRLNDIAHVLGAADGPTLAAMDAYLKDDFRAAMRELSDARKQLQLLGPEKNGDSPEAKRLAKREALAKARVEEIEKSLAKSSEYRLDLENLKSLIAQTEKLSGSLAEAIERLKIELGAPSRVTLADEAHVRRPTSPPAARP